MNEMMSLEQIQQEAADQIAALMYQDPELAEFGIMISENIGMPSDQITVLWFCNTEQLEKFLELSLPFSYCSIEELEEIPEEISEIARAIKALDKPTLQPDQVEIINPFMKLSSIEWSGTFNEMCEAKGNAEKMMINWFRQDGSKAKPIDENERENFKDFLMNNMDQ